jgi:hypothetical protein
LFSPAVGLQIDILGVLVLTIIALPFDSFAAQPRNRRFSVSGPWLPLNFSLMPIKHLKPFRVAQKTVVRRPRIFSNSRFVPLPHFLSYFPIQSIQIITILPYSPSYIHLWIPGIFPAGPRCILLTFFSHSTTFSTQSWTPEHRQQSLNLLSAWLFEPATLDLVLFVCRGIITELVHRTLARKPFATPTQASPISCALSKILLHCPQVKPLVIDYFNEAPALMLGAQLALTGHHDDVTKLTPDEQVRSLFFAIHYSRSK